MAQKNTTSTKASTAQSRLAIQWWHAILRRKRSYQSRRPHRSFRLTQRRDYERSFVMPGYIAFTHEVMATIWKHKRIFAYLLGLYAVLSVLFVTTVSQSAYQQLVDSIDETATTSGVVIDGVTRATLIVSTIANGALGSESGDVQQVYGILLLLMMFLTTVWILRAYKSGSRLKLRDALYSAGAPIVATTVIGGIIMLQLLPGLVGVVGYQSLVQTDLFSTGLLAMLIALAAILLVLISLYLVTSSLFAILIVTLPGMYPLQAMKAAGDLVIGRRLRILFRLSWLVVILAVLWSVVLIPSVLAINYLQAHVSQIAGLPIVPMLVLLMGGATVIIATNYIYLLYRRMVDDDALPA